MTKLKQLFSTPKKAMVTIVCILAMVAVLSTATVFAASTIAESSSIGAENAKNFAFADAGIDPLSASNVKAEFDYEHGQFVYEVEFVAGNSEYEYCIKASSGAVVKKQVEIVKQDGSNVMATAEITMEKAKEIALADASLTGADITFKEEKLDVENGISVYDIEFYTDNAAYKYEINAATGAIYSKSKVITESQTTSVPAQKKIESTQSTTEENTQPIQETAENTQSAQNSQSNQTNTTDDIISIETAKNKALADAEVSVSAATFIKAKLDYDDGIPTYDIEFYTSSYEYDYEINARTGAITSKDVEAIRTASQQQSSNTNSYIGIEKAKSIALSHAGVSDVTYTKAKLDSDDGQIVYEIEFRKDRVEYEYTIRATDGFILDHDSEWD